MKNVLTTTFQNFQMSVSENFSFFFWLEFGEIRNAYNKNKTNTNNSVKMHVSMLGGPSTKLYNCRKVRSTSVGSTASEKKNRDEFRETDQKVQLGNLWTSNLKEKNNNKNKKRNPNGHFCFPIYFACFEL